MEKISVIVPVYNMERYVEKCIDSILQSTYEDIECILVNDGSKDKSAEICDAYAEKDKRIKVIHKENGGLTSARRAGFESATGQYVCFVDSDDYIAADMLEKLFVLLSEANADVSVCGHYKDDEGTIKEKTFHYYEKVIEKREMIDKYVLPIIGKIYAPGYRNYPGYVWGRLYRKECITEQCFVSEREVYTEDDLFQMYLSDHIQKVVFTNEKLCYYRENSESLTHAHRNNLYPMLKKRHACILEFFKEHGRSQETERILGSLFYTIYVSIENAYRLNNYKAFRCEAKEIRNDSLSKELIEKMDIKLLRPRQLMFFYLFKMKSYLGMYWFRKVLFR